jgi:hypothetical protein
VHEHGVFAGHCYGGFVFGSAPAACHQMQALFAQITWRVEGAEDVVRGSHQQGVQIRIARFADG